MPRRDAVVTPHQPSVNACPPASSRCTGTQSSWSLWAGGAKQLTVQRVVAGDVANVSLTPLRAGRATAATRSRRSPGRHTATKSRPSLWASSTRRPSLVQVIFVYLSETNAGIPGNCVSVLAEVSRSQTSRACFELPYQAGSANANATNRPLGSTAGRSSVLRTLGHPSSAGCREPRVINSSFRLPLSATTPSRPTATMPDRVDRTVRPDAGSITRERWTTRPRAPPSGSVTVAQGKGRGARSCIPSRATRCNWHREGLTVRWIHTERLSAAAQTFVPLPRNETRPEGGRTL